MWWYTILYTSHNNLSNNSYSQLISLLPSKLSLLQNKQMNHYVTCICHCQPLMCREHHKIWHDLLDCFFSVSPWLQRNQNQQDYLPDDQLICGLVTITAFISLAQVVPSPVYPYSADSWPKTPFILFHFHFIHFKLFLKTFFTLNVLSPLLKKLLEIYDQRLSQVAAILYFGR